MLVGSEAIHTTCDTSNGLSQYNNFQTFIYSYSVKHLHCSKNVSLYQKGHLANKKLC